MGAGCSRRNVSRGQKSQGSRSNSVWLELTWRELVSKANRWVGNRLWMNPSVSLLQSWDLSLSVVEAIEEFKTGEGHDLACDFERPLWLLFGKWMRKGRAGGRGHSRKILQQGPLLVSRT